MADKVKEVAIEEADRVRGLAADAAKSGAFLYPLKGIYYFLTHRSLWRPLGNRLIPTFSLGLGITTFMFAFTYVPQMAVMAFTSGPVAAVTAALLVLSESSTLINIFAKSFLIEDALIDTFDGTLVARECTTLVSDGRQLKSGSDPIARLGKVLKKPFAKFTPKALIRYVMYLPLNFIPIVGTVIFVIVQGKKAGPERHARYFQLKEMSKSEREAWVEKHRGAYTSFGIAAYVFEMVPVASIIFAFTNTVGAALWAADIERKKSMGASDADAGNTAPRLRETAKKAE